MTEIGAPVSVLGTVSASQAAKAGDCVVLGNDLKIPSTFYEQGGGSSEPSTPVVIQTDMGWDQLELAFSLNVVNYSTRFTATGVKCYLVDLSDGTSRLLDGNNYIIDPGESVHIMGGDDTLDNTIVLAYATYMMGGIFMQTPPVVINVGKD